MARLLKIFKAVRNHWKKSVFGLCVVSYGGYWLYGKQCDNLLRRAACQEARNFGAQLISSGSQVKKATVILNPAACKGKANNLFEKNVAPILNLAGIDVKVIKTDYEGQAKKLLDLMEPADLIIIAGGNGTLQEVITGLLRRADEDVFSKIPIGFIPLGTTNTLSHTLFPPCDNKVKLISDSTLDILRGETISLDVMQIKGKTEQPVFSLTDLRWGSYRDTATKISKYWYLGPLKTKAAHLFSTLKEWPQVHHGSLAYLGPTLRPRDETIDKPPRPPLHTRILQRLYQYWAPVKKEIVEADVEPWQEMTFSGLEFSITTKNSHPDLMRTEDSLTICIEPNTISKLDFTSLGSAKVKDPSVFPQDAICLQASQCRFQVPEENPGCFGIDSEEYEAMPVDVLLLPRKLHFFCNSTIKQELLQGSLQGKANSEKNIL
ncbi:acylglycerol kinase, mitochondrial [Polypterus senegalus]|uniref:acylglycerol kinase, mitochondrial n=1 Tax=Polypterus senegalus TaxID=55291 RepID=UPI001963B594|nr:acylglycerol kinase, mitochondrial [Polypterus senegalus]